MEDWVFADPPVWEAALLAVTESSSVFDPYEIATVHGLFADEYPRAERQSLALSVEPFQLLVQTPTLIPQIQFAPMVDLSRWWFISGDGHHLLQLQENLVSQNWRRTDLSPAPQQAYKNFKALKADFKANVAKLTAYHERQARQLPPPRVACLTYVNHIRARLPDGTRRTIRDMMPFLNFTDGIMKGNLNAGWFEAVPDCPVGLDATMAITANIVGVPIPDEAGQPAQFGRLAFDARAAVTSWDQLLAVANAAHAYMRKRLLDLTSVDLRATWK